MTYNAAYRQEPDHDIHYLAQPRGIFAFGIVHSDLAQEVQAYIEIKDGTDPNRAKKANEECLLHLLNLADLAVHGEHDRNPSKYKNQDPQENKAINGNDIIAEERSPRAYGAEPHEDR